MTEIAQTARGASMLILAEAAQGGFIARVNGTWDLAPGVKELAKFLNVERSAISALGMGRRIKEVTLQDIFDNDPEDSVQNAPQDAQDAPGATNAGEDVGEQGK